MDKKTKDRVLTIDEALAEVFWPTLDSNRETTEFCIELASGIGTTMVTELEDDTKATHAYLSAKDGNKSQKMPQMRRRQRRWVSERAMTRLRVDLPR